MSFTIFLLARTLAVSQEVKISDEKIGEWSEPYRNWQYYPGLVIPSNPDIYGFEDVKMTDVPTVFQIPNDDKWYMSFIGFDGQGYQSFIAESEDLVHWGNYRMAMGYGPEGDFDYGGVVLGAYPYEDYDINAPRRYSSTRSTSYACSQELNTHFYSDNTYSTRFSSSLPDRLLVSPCLSSELNFINTSFIVFALPSYR